MSSFDPTAIPFLGDYITSDPAFSDSSLYEPFSRSQRALLTAVQNVNFNLSALFTAQSLTQNYLLNDDGSRGAADTMSSWKTNGAGDDGKSLLVSGTYTIQTAIIQKCRTICKPLATQFPPFNSGDFFNSANLNVTGSILHHYRNVDPNTGDYVEGDDDPYTPDVALGPEEGGIAADIIKKNGDYQIALCAIVYFGIFTGTDSVAAYSLGYAQVGFALHTGSWDAWKTQLGIDSMPQFPLEKAIDLSADFPDYEIPAPTLNESTDNDISASILVPVKLSTWTQNQSVEDTAPQLDENGSVTSTLTVTPAS